MIIFNYFNRFKKRSVGNETQEIQKVYVCCAGSHNGDFLSGDRADSPGSGFVAKQGKHKGTWRGTAPFLRIPDEGREELGFGDGPVCGNDAGKSTAAGSQRALQAHPGKPGNGIRRPNYADAGGLRQLLCGQHDVQQ